MFSPLRFLFTCGVGSSLKTKKAMTLDRTFWDEECFLQDELHTARLACVHEQQTTAKIYITWLIASEQKRSGSWLIARLQVVFHSWHWHATEMHTLFMFHYWQMVNTSSFDSTIKVSETGDSPTRKSRTKGQHTGTSQRQYQGTATSHTLLISSE